MGNYAKMSPIRRSRSISSYQDGEIPFEILIEIGYISYGACKELEIVWPTLDFQWRGESIWERKRKSKGEGLGEYFFDSLFSILIPWSFWWSPHKGFRLPSHAVQEISYAPGQSIEPPGLVIGNVHITNRKENLFYGS